MVTTGLLVRFEAVAGKEVVVTELLRSAMPMVRDEAATTAWFGIRFAGARFGIVDVFPDDDSRRAHLSGPVAEALMAQADQLFTSPPDITHLEVLADKLPPGPAAPVPVTKALLLTFKAKASKNDEVEQFLRSAESIVAEEPGTIAWFAIGMGDGQYGIFDVFADNKGRLAHLSGKVPRALARNALSLVGSVPDMKMIDVLADKLPG
jgi:quinol monooxygenase YgiN